MTDREQMYWEVAQEEQIWKPLNRRQERSAAWIEVIAIVLALGGCTAFWYGLAHGLAIARHYFHV